MISRQGYTGNETDSPDFLKVLLTLKENVMKSTNVAEVGQVEEIATDGYFVRIFDTNSRIKCIKLASVPVNVKDIVLVVFNNTDFRNNLNKINNYQPTQVLADGLLHSLSYGIITGSFSQSGGSGITVDDTLSTTSTNPVQNKVITTALNGKQPSGDYIEQGGTLTAPLTVRGGDSATAGKIILSRSASGQMTDESTSTLLGWLSNNTSTFTVGGNSYALNLRGNATRPTYKGNDLALFSDIASQSLPNFTLQITHNTAGNPRQVKFLTIDYTNYTSESAAYFKLSAMSCHGNGVSYQFLEDIIIGCSMNADVTCQVYKYIQVSCGTVDSVNRYYGDVYYTVDTANHLVDFYILCGQYSFSNFTPRIKIGNTTNAGITQYTGTASYYSSGTKVWADGDGATYVNVPYSSNATPNTLVMRDASGDTYARYVYGTWLKSTGSYDIGSSNWNAVWVDDGNGWLYKRTKSNFINDLVLQSAYPVGSIYMSVEATSPASIFGGSWTELPAGYVLWTAKWDSTGVTTDTDVYSKGGTTNGIITAGLPNITGSIGNSSSENRLLGGSTNKRNIPYTGAFTVTHQSSVGGLGNGNGYSEKYYLDFNASRVNSIYGNSNTVQPPALKVYMWRRTA